MSGTTQHCTWRTSSWTHGQWSHSTRAVALPSTDFCRCSCTDVLVEAIGQGAPKFNAGDIKGCANIYRQAAETALRSSNATEGQKMRLRAGLQGAGGSASDEAAAWALRNAFDDVLAGSAGVFNTKSAFAFSSSSQPNGASAGFNRGIHATQIVMGLISIVFSCSFIPTIVEGHFNDGGIGRPMRSLEWIYALIWFAIGVPMGLSAAAAGFFYFRGWKTGPKSMSCVRGEHYNGVFRFWCLDAGIRSVM